MYAEELLQELHNCNTPESFSDLLEHIYEWREKHYEEHLAEEIEAMGDEEDGEACQEIEEGFFDTEQEVEAKISELEERFEIYS